MGPPPDLAGADPARSRDALAPSGGLHALRGVAPAARVEARTRSRCAPAPSGSGVPLECHAPSHPTSLPAPHREDLALEADLAL